MRTHIHIPSRFCGWRAAAGKLEGSNEWNHSGTQFIQSVIQAIDLPYLGILRITACFQLLEAVTEGNHSTAVPLAAGINIHEVLAASFSDT